MKKWCFIVSDECGDECVEMEVYLVVLEVWWCGGVEYLNW